MAVQRSIWPVLGVVTLMLATGCQTLGSCRQPLSDATAPEIPPLKMPVGLEGPDTTQALSIPPLAQPELPRGKDDPCLQEPPPMREPGSQTPIEEDKPAEAGNTGEGAPPRRRPVSPPR
jgi:hypothetical protein